MCVIEILKNDINNNLEGLREELQFNYAFKFRRRWTSKFFERCWSCNGHTPRLFLLRTRFQEAASVPLSFGGRGR